MKVTVANWVHRTIRSQDRFVDARDDESLQTAYAWVGIPIIGVYRNPPGISPMEIILTECFLLARSDQDQTRIAFDQIADIGAPEKGSGGRIHLKLKSGECSDLVVAGRQGNFEDVYEFVRLLRRVTELPGEPSSG